MDYSYKRVGSRGFLDTVGAVERSIRAHGFAVAHVHDLQATLAVQGLRHRPAAHLRDQRPTAAARRRDGRAGARGAREARDAHAVPGERLRRGGEVVVAAVRPTVMCRVFPEAELDEVARAVEAIVVELVDEAVA